MTKMGAIYFLSLRPQQNTAWWPPLCRHCTVVLSLPQRRRDARRTSLFRKIIPFPGYPRHSQFIIIHSSKNEPEVLSDICLYSWDQLLRAFVACLHRIISVRGKLLSSCRCVGLLSIFTPYKPHPIVSTNECARRRMNNTTG